MFKKILISSTLICSLGFCGCSSVDDLEDVIDSIDVPRKSIPVEKMGVNAFGNESFAGSICSQYRDVKNTLNLKFVRVLFNWDDNVQPTPASEPNFSFYDDILNCIPNGVDALVVLTKVPSWMSNSANWVNGNPRTTFVERWVSRVARRYAGNGKIAGYQVWNEPNNTVFSENNILEVTSNPSNYLELISRASNVIKDIDPGRRVVSGSTTGIATGYPETFNYNKALIDGGLQSMVDVYGIHYYGTNYERFNKDIKDFLRGISLPIWVTESGKQGVTEQLEYTERTWPFITERVPGIQRIYYYQYAENSPAALSFGMRTPDPTGLVSDLYIYLRDRQ